MDSSRQEESNTFTRGKDPLRHAFCLLAALELGQWPSWEGPFDRDMLRARVEALALLFDIVPRADLPMLDVVLLCWVTRFPNTELVPLDQLRYAGRAVLHSSEAGVPGPGKDRAGSVTVLPGCPAVADPPADAPIPPGDQLDRALSEWKRRVTTERRWTHLPAFVPGEPASQIEEVYVELYAVSEHDITEDLNADSERAMRVSRRLLAEQQPVVGVTTLAARTLERCVVVGEPGSGKSTLVQWLTNATYRNVVPDYDHALFVKLSAYATTLEHSPGTNLLDYFFTPLVPDKAERQQVLSRLRQKAAEERRHLLLLDGWDEVPLPLRESVREQILTEGQNFVTIVTSRPSGLPRELREDGHVEFYRLAGLAPRATEELTRKLLRRLNCSDLFETVIRRLHEEPDLREMAANPFLLGLLVRVLARTSGRATPRTLADVYQQITDWMQEQHNRSNPRLDALTAEHLAVLGRLSHGLLYGSPQPGYVFHIQKMGSCLAEQRVSQEPILRSRFTNRIDPDFDEYCFLHATLQEYLAATHAAAFPQDDLSRFLDQSFWSASRLVVLEFAAGLDTIAERCRQRAVGWFRSLDRFHHVLLRLARLAAAGRWRIDDPDGLGMAIRQELWRVIEAKENATVATAAMHAFAELDPVDLVNRTIESKDVDFLFKRKIVESVPRWVIAPEKLESILDDGPWRAFSSLMVVKATSDEDLVALRKVLQDPSADHEARISAVRIAGMSRDPGAAPVLIQMLQPHFPDDDLRKEAIDSLGRIGGQESIQALIALILDGERPEELADHASAALSIHGCAALDPSGRDRLLRRIAASDPSSRRLHEMFYALRGYPIRTSAEVVADIARQADLPAKLRIEAVQVVATATDRGVVQRLADSAITERDEAMRQELCRLAMDRSVSLPEEWLRARIVEDSNNVRRTLFLAVYLLQVARAPRAHRVREQAFLHGLIVTALASGAPDYLAGSLNRALTQPEPTPDPIFPPETLKFVLGIVDAFVTSHAGPTVDQLVLAANVIRHFPKKDGGRSLRAMLDAALLLSHRSEDSLVSQEWDRLSGYAAALLAGMDPGELLNYPPGCVFVDNALQEASIRRGWLVFADRILDAEGHLIASLVRSEIPQVGNSSAESLGSEPGIGPTAPQATSSNVSAVTARACGEEGAEDRLRSEEIPREESTDENLRSDALSIPAEVDQWLTPAEPGIERMLEEAAEMLPLLISFRRYGQFCRKQGSSGTLSLQKIALEFNESPTQLRSNLTRLSSFFRKYFETFEHLEVPEDKDDMPSTDAATRKIFERGQGKKFRIYTRGWRAWWLTCLYLVRVAGIPLPECDD